MPGIDIHSHNVKIFSYAVHFGTREVALQSPLSHWERDKIAAIFKRTFQSSFSGTKMVVYLFEFNFIFLPKGPISNWRALAQITE